jgi:carbon monoxide dehydrogenase subunit G
VSWWLPSSEQTLTELVPADPDRVRQFYADLDNLTLVHPLVVSVRHLAADEYRVRDRIALGPFSFRISYSVRLHVTEKVVAQARQFPRVRVHTVVSFERVDGGTRVVERLRTSAPRPLAAYTHRQAVTAHGAMLATIRVQFG